MPVLAWKIWTEPFSFPLHHMMSASQAASLWPRTINAQTSDWWWLIRLWLPGDEKMRTRTQIRAGHCHCDPISPVSPARGCVLPAMLHCLSQEIIWSMITNVKAVNDLTKHSLIAFNVQLSLAKIQSWVISLHLSLRKAGRILWQWLAIWLILAYPGLGLGSLEYCW